MLMKRPEDSTLEGLPGRFLKIRVPQQSQIEAAENGMWNSSWSHSFFLGVFNRLGASALGRVPYVGKQLHFWTLAIGCLSNSRHPQNRILPTTRTRLGLVTFEEPP